MAVSDPKHVRLALDEAVEIITLDGTIVSSAPPSEAAFEVIQRISEAHDDADLARSLLTDLTKP